MLPVQPFFSFALCTADDGMEIPLRRQTRTVQIGSVSIGGGNPVAVQSMWAEPVRADEMNEVRRKLMDYRSIGCRLMRFAVRNEEDVAAAAAIQQFGIMPVIADIHFDYRLASAALENGIPKIRINPGNIGAVWKTEEIIDRALGHDAAVRIGVNAGSLPGKLRKSDDISAAMTAAAEKYIDLFEKKEFKKLVISLKASDPDINYQVNHHFSSLHDYPLHVGVTEAGPIIPSVVKNTYALSKLFQEGIGDTVRISISDDIRNEIIAAREILSLFGLNRKVDIISCPRCGRATFDTHAFLRQVEDSIYAYEKDISVAVMGCTVNGPEEAKHADLGITGMAGRIFLFKKGKILKETSGEHAAEDFLQELKKL